MGVFVCLVAAILSATTRLSFPTFLQASASIMQCPKCGFRRNSDDLECLRCGVIFAKLDSEALGEGWSQEPEPHGSAHIESKKIPGARASLETPPVSRGQSKPESPPLGREDEEAGRVHIPEELLTTEDDGEYFPEPSHMGRDQWVTLAWGLGIALLVFVIPRIFCGFFSAWLGSTFAALMTLIHEAGHSVFGWLFGYPSLPAFDFMYGGGVALHIGRSWLLVAAVYAALVALIYLARGNALTVCLLVLFGLVHAVLAFTEGHQVIILFMGHGTELIIAALFIYRALSGSAVVHEVERPLYAAIGFWITLYDLAFAWSLITSESARFDYGEAKGGGHWMDFDRIAREFLHVDLVTVAIFFFLICAVTIPVGYLGYRYQQYIRSMVVSLTSKTAT